MRSPLDIALGRSLRNVLNDVWDPIGVKPYGVLDEYDHYIWPLMGLLRSEPPPQQQGIVEALLLIEHDQMGMTGQPDRAKAAARAMLIKRWRPDEYRSLTEFESAVVAKLLGFANPELRDEFLAHVDSYRCHALDEYGSIAIEGGPNEPLQPALKGMIANGQQVDDDPAPTAARIELLLFVSYGRPRELQILRQDGMPIVAGLRPDDIEVLPAP